MKQRFFQTKGRNRWEITDRMFFSLFITGTIIEFSQVGAGFIDGLVISRFLGSFAMAAEGIVHPIYSIIGVISGLLAVGMQVRCAQAIGRGNRKEYTRFVSITIYVGTALSLLTMVIVLAFAKPIAVLMGASGNAADLADDAAKYLMGIGIGIPPLIMTAILAPALQLDTGRKTVQTGAIIEACSNIAMDLIAVKLNKGMFGVGLATAIASYLNLLYQCSFFLKKDRILHFVRPEVSLKEFLSMLSGGGEKAIKRLANTLRPIVLNSIMISYGGALAMSVLSVRNNFYNFVAIFGAGIASAIALLTGVYYGEINEEAIEEVYSCRNRTAIHYSGTVCVLMLIFARPLARLYITGEEAVLDMAVFAFRMLAIQVPLRALIDSRIKYLQAIRRKQNMNVLIAVTQVVFVLISAFALGRLFGVYGILACFTVSDGLTLLAVLVLYAVKSRTVVPSQKDLLNLPDYFECNPGDVISLDIVNNDEVSLASEQLMLFCKGHKIDPRISYYAALTFEELAANTISVGFPQCTAGTPTIDLRVVVAEGHLVVRLRDNCPSYDVTKQIAAANEDMSDPSHNLGIRMVSKIASDITYLNTFETNNLIIRFDI